MTSYQNMSNEIMQHPSVPPPAKKVPLLGAVDGPCPTSAPNPPTAAAALPFAPPPGKRRALGDLLESLGSLKAS